VKQVAEIAERVIRPVGRVVFGVEEHHDLRRRDGRRVRPPHTAAKRKRRGGNQQLVHMPRVIQISSKTA